MNQQFTGILAKIGRPRSFSRPVRYAAAVLAVAVACCISVAIRELAGTRAIGASSVFLLAVVITSWYGGLGPGLLSAVLGAACYHYLFVPPIDTLKLVHLEDEVRIFIFLITAVLTVAFNATTRVAHMETERSKRELQDFLENGAIALDWIGPHGSILWANQAELEMMGYPADAYLGHHIAEFHEDRAVAEDMLARLRRGEALEGYAARLRTRDGRVLEVLIDANALWEDGEFIHSRCFTRNVTAERRAHSALVESERRLQVEHDEVQRLYELESAARADAEMAAARTASLEALATALVEAATPQEVGNTLLQQAATSLGAATGRLLLVDREAGLLRSVAARGVADGDRDLPLDAQQSRLAMAVSERRGIFISSPEEEREQFAAPNGARNPAWASLPILSRDEVVAVADFGWNAPRQFPPDDIDLMFAFGRLTAQALERARLYSAERALRTQAEQVTSRVSRLQAVTAALGETMTQHQVSDVVLREGMGAVNAATGVIAILNRTTAELEVAAQRGLPRDAIIPGLFHLGRRTLLTDAVTSGRTILLRTPDDQQRFEPGGVAFLPDESSWAAIPIIHNDDVFGAIRLGWKEPQSFSSDEVILLETLARQTGQALERARLYQSEQQARRGAEHSAYSLARLHASRSALARALTPSAVAQVIVTEGVAAMQAKSGTVSLLSEDGTVLEVGAYSGYQPEVVEPWRERGIPLDANIHMSEAVRDRRPVYCTSREQLAQRFPEGLERFDQTGIQSLASVPLLVQDRCFGALTVAFSHARSLSQEEKDLLQAFANQGAQALDRARLYSAEQTAREAAERAAGRLSQLQEVTSALAEAVTVDDVDRVFTEKGIPLAGAWAGTIYLLDKSQNQLEALTSGGYVSMEDDMRVLDFERFPTLRPVVESLTPSFYSGAQSLDTEAQQMVARNGGRSVAWATLPLHHEAGCTGVMVLSYEVPQAFNDEQRGILLTLSRLFAQGVDRAQLYEAERNLRARLNAVVSDVPGIVWEAWGRPDDPQQRIDFVSDYAEHMLGYSVEEWLSTPNFWLTVVHPEDREAAAAKAVEGFERGGPTINRFRWIRKDGGIVHALSHSSVILDADEKPAGIRCVTVDVTQEHKAEEALRASELRAQAVLNTAANGIITINEDGLVETMNPAAERIFGYSAGEVIGNNVSLLMPAADGVRHSSHIDNYLRTGTGKIIDAGSREVSGKRKDGTTFPLELAVSELTAGGKRTFTGIVNDISERRRAQSGIEFLVHASEVLSSSLDYETTLKSLAHLAVPQIADWCAIEIWEHDRLERIALVHTEGEKVEMVRGLEAKTAEFRAAATTHQALLDFRARLLTDIPDEQIEAIEDPETREITRILRPRSSMTVPLVGQGENFGVISFVTAESERRYDEGDLELAEELGRRAGIAIENARLFRESQLIQAELRRSNEAKDEFLGLVSHELRTPITSIYGGARFLHLRAAQVDEKTRDELILTIEHESERMYRLVENLLALARTDLGGEIPVEPVALSALAEKAAKGFKAQHSSRKVEFKDAAPGLLVLAEPTYIEQVIQNLLSNADKYSPADAPIEVTVEAAEDQLSLKVCDRGPGIAPEEANLIFDSFYRSSATSDKAPGKGLGLTVCKRLIEAQNGHIWARPRRGGGLEVAFSLPLATTETHEHAGRSNGARVDSPEPDAAHV